MKIGWIGLGNMGVPMARNLVQAGHDVMVFNRTYEKSLSLVQMGARAAKSLEEIASHADLIVTMLSDGQAVQDVLVGTEGILSYLKASQIVVDMSTIAPDQSRNLAKLVSEKGVQMLDAPVSGSVKPAEDGTLVILVGGDEEVYRRVEPIFEVLGKAAYYLGPNGKGLEAKLAVNMMLGITMQGVAEALLVAEKAGISRDPFLQMLSNTAVSSPLLQGKLESYRKESFPAAFSLKHMNKDLALAAQYAYQNRYALPLTSVAHSTYTSAEASGKGELDVAAVMLQVFEQSGVGLKKETKHEETGGFSRS